MVKKILGWLALVLVVYYIATAPAEAGSTTKALLAGAANVGNGVIAFLKSATS